MQDFSTKQNNKITTIKIIAGIFRGKILEARILPTTRPTKAIVKESVFNTIAPILRGKIFVEVFAGYGSMGFEALSRGVEKVIFLEKDKLAFGVLQKNIALFTGESHKILAKNVDSFEVLGKMLGESKNAIFYFDPPFGENGEFYKRIFEILDSADLAIKKDLGKSLDSGESSIDSSTNLTNKILIFEHISTFKMPDSLANIPLQKCKKFGRTSISYYFMA